MDKYILFMRTYKLFIQFILFIYINIITVANDCT